MKLHIPILFLILTLIFTGCTHFTSPARIKDIDEKESYWLDYDASRRGAFFIYDGKKIKTCSEPSPDVAYKLTEKLKASVTYGGATGTGEGDFGQDVVKLAKRTQMIMFLREALFRLCELSLNADLPPEKHVELYEKVLETSSTITETEQLEEFVKLETLKSGHSTNEATKCLRKFWKPDGKVNKENEKKIKEWIKQNIKKQVSITFFLNSKMFSKERTQAAQELACSN